MKHNEWTSAIKSSVASAATDWVLSFEGLDVSAQAPYHTSGSAGSGSDAAPQSQAGAQQSVPSEGGSLASSVEFPKD